MYVFVYFVLLFTLIKIPLMFCPDILRDKTMDDKLTYIPFCRLKLLVKTAHQELIQVPKVLSQRMRESVYKLWVPE